MYHDAQLLFTKQTDGTLYQVISGAAGTTNSTNIIDFGAAGTPAQGLEMLYRKDRGNKMPFLAQVVGPGGITDTGFAGSGGTSVQLVLQCDDDSAFGSAQTLYTSAAIAVATLVPGYRFLIDELPPATAAIAADSRYFRCRFVTLGTITPVATTSTCAVQAGFVAGLQDMF